MCPRVDSRYVNLFLLERVKFHGAFENCLILLNRMVCNVFTAKKAWMTTEIMIQVLTALDRKLDVENRKVLLFSDNAPSHPETLQGNPKNIKLVFLSKKLVILVSSDILRLSIANNFWNMLFQGSMMEKRHLKLFKRLIFYSV